MTQSNVSLMKQTMDEREKYKILVFTSSLMDYISRFSDFYKYFISKLFIEDNFSEFTVLEETEYLYNKALNLMIDTIYYHRNISIRNEETSDYIAEIMNIVNKHLVRNIIKDGLRYKNILLVKSITDYVNDYIEWVLKKKILKENKIKIPPRINGDFFENADVIVGNLYKFSKSLIIHTINSDNILRGKNKIYIDNSIVDMCLVYDCCPLWYIPQDFDINDLNIVLLKEIPEYVINELKERIKEKKRKD